VVTVVKGVPNTFVGGVEDGEKAFKPGATVQPGSSGEPMSLRKK